MQQADSYIYLIIITICFSYLLFPCTLSLPVFFLHILYVTGAITCSVIFVMYNSFMRAFITCLFLTFILCLLTLFLFQLSHWETGEKTNDNNKQASKQTNKQTSKQANKQTITQTSKQASKQTNKQTKIQK